MLEIKNLSKTYSGKVKALRDVSLKIRPGIFGLLGPNGAGKTTLMRIVATILTPDEGDAFFNGFSAFEKPMELKKALGYLPQDFGLYDNISAQDMLSHFAALKGYHGKNRKSVVENLLKTVSLYDERLKKLGAYSGGMKRRFGIAIALLGNPKLLIIDEPTAGLDPEERRKFLRILLKTGENRITIFSTHIVADIEEMASEMAILNKGEIIVSGSPEEYKNQLTGKIFSVLVREEEISEIKQNHRVLNIKMREGKYEVIIFSEKAPEKPFNPYKPTLEEVYFYHVNNKKESIQ
jgi:ABC-type multidrug transport system ATPase subunit